MANVKSRLKAPKSASTKKKRGRKPKKSSTGPDKNKPEVKINDTIKHKDCDVVMRRPSTRKVMTPDEKIQFLLKNGHKLKEKFIAKPPPNVKRTYQNSEPRDLYRKRKVNKLLMTKKSGQIKKKTKSSKPAVKGSLKKKVLSNGRNTKKTVNGLAPVIPPVASPPLLAGVDNNNDIEITDQNNKCQDLTDEGSELNLSDISAVSNNLSENKNCSSDISVKKCVKKSEKKKALKPYEKKTRKKHVKLKNGVVLKLVNFECDHCHKTFNRKCSLRRHMYLHLGIKPFHCPRCPQEFRSRYNLQIHFDRYHQSNESEFYICDFCGKLFLNKKNLKKHLETHVTNENTYKCIYCSKAYAHHTLLMQHEKKHMVRGRHECTLCSMSYRCRNLLYLHVKSHLKIKDFICQYCGKEFLRQSSLRRHVEVSHGGHRIVCPVCKKNLKGHLTEHMRTHEKKRPHVCPECGQRFTQSTQLNVHRRAHTGDRPYPCRICKRFFSHSNALMLHIRRHTGEKPFPCAMCPMSFSQLPHMKTHMRKIHGKENPYRCSKCDSFYKLKAQLDVHAKTCGVDGTVDEPTKGKSKKSKKGDDEIEVESPMSLSRMRFLLALLLTMIATKEKLKYLGFNKRLVDEILVESLEAMDQSPCKDECLSPVKRLRKNIEMFIHGTVPREEMENFRKENKSTEDILELLTNEKDK